MYFRSQPGRSSIGIGCGPCSSSCLRSPLLSVVSVLIAITPTACPASFKIGEPDMPGSVKLIDNVVVPQMFENLCKRILTQLRSNVIGAAAHK